MKTFFGSFLGALTALVVFTIGAILCSFLFLAIVGSTFSREDKSPVVEKGAYLVFDMSVNVTDAPAQLGAQGMLGALAGGDREPRRLQLRQVTRALEAAAADNRIAGVFLLGEFQPGDYGTGYPALREIRVALENVRAAKKPVIAYLENATVREMYLASLADDIALDPYGMIIMPGLASEPMYFAGALEKFGVGVQVTRVGKYKSAIEPYTRKDMSPESREQMQKLLDDLWGDLRETISLGRGLDAAALQTAVDKDGIMLPASALDRKLVTRLAYRDEVYEDLKTRTGRAGTKEPFKQINLAEYARMLSPATGPVLPERDSHDTTTATGTSAGSGKHVAGGGRGTVAIVYAEGAIVDGKGGLSEVGGDRFSRELRRLRQDKNVKAIVLRVNSPGGSATASEHILREVQLARKEKPVVVSMGAYAASGGYWISTYGDRIFAEPSTITGSIGVFGMQFDVQKLAGSVGLTFDSVKTGKFADTMTISRPKTAEEMALYQRMVDWIYEQFISKVSESRNLPKERVQEIAQGRVWSGAEALKLGLVDELGGLDDAIIHAAQKAGLGQQYRVREFPRKKEFAEIIAEIFGDLVPEESGAGASTATQGVLDDLLSRFKAEARLLNQFNDPKGIYARLPFECEVK